MAIVILDNYDSFTYNLYQMVQAQTALPVLVYRNNALSWADLLSIRPSAVILSPGPGHPANPQDFGLCRQVIEKQEILNCPVLGICLGHQGIAYVLGGDVVPAPCIQHGKVSTVKHDGSHPLFNELPLQFQVMRYHSWMVKTETLPEDLRIIAQTVILPEEGASRVIMGISHRTRPLYGVQFHPESIGTPLGAKILKNFLSMAASH